jgi:hypothetical protein
MDYYAELDAQGLVLRISGVEGPAPAGLTLLPGYAGTPAKPDSVSSLVFVSGALAWQDRRTLAQAQADQWATIKAQRDAKILAAGATAIGTFDTTIEGLANVTSVAVMLMANPAIASVNFTLADNTRPSIARADFLAAAQTIGAAVQALYDHAATLRTQIEAATTTAAVQAIAW